MSSSAADQQQSSSLDAAHVQSMYSWEANAEFWDNSIGQDGNQYWQLLQRPALERMIPLPSPETRPGRRALDLAAGNGVVSRWLAARGDLSVVVSTDGSEEMMRVSRKRYAAWSAGGSGSGSGDVAQMEFRRVDVTSEKDLEAIVSEFCANETGGDGDARFDIVTINMAIQDISDLVPMAKALPNLLKKGGIFVATLLHPVFFTSGANRHIQIIENDEHHEATANIVRSKVVTRYLDVAPWRGVAMYGQPEQQYYFHRPLHELFATFFRVGLAMDALEEPAFTDAERNADRIESHFNFTQLPAILAFRMRHL
ncbi:S-adenosyl-L-methionine-dependent methyltransferase [Microdochium bolleyi]|uniref:S-adenosyl-L-methionine-dependent methyltransferase n=1 Tax=Microdochium bolleyi TaxID=196109 RepID=A0A136JH41_9PEZI|nr:S-adenosyl-L-methionine-dependent methyltransferase [Microdochium bolleyi]